MDIYQAGLKTSDISELDREERSPHIDSDDNSQPNEGIVDGPLALAASSIWYTPRPRMGISTLLSRITFCIGDPPSIPLFSFAQPVGYFAFRPFFFSAPNSQTFSDIRTWAELLDILDATPQAASLMGAERNDGLSREVVIGEERGDRHGYGAPPVRVPDEDNLIRANIYEPS